jgi:hypothetical protein
MDVAEHRDSHFTILPWPEGVVASTSDPDDFEARHAVIVSVLGNHVQMVSDGRGRYPRIIQGHPPTTVS